MNEDNSFSYTHDQDITNEELFAILGRPYLCPWCNRSKVPERRLGKWIPRNQYWVKTPLRRDEPKWVCIGCYIDVYCACNSLAFSQNPDRSLVVKQAVFEGLSTDDFRRIAWQHQLAVIQADRQNGRLEAGSIGLENRLIRLMLGEA
jgi:hypothetical protein